MLSCQPRITSTVLFGTEKEVKGEDEAVARGDEVPRRFQHGEMVSVAKHCQRMGHNVSRWRVSTLPCLEDEGMVKPEVQVAKGGI